MRNFYYQTTQLKLFLQAILILVACGCRLQSSKPLFTSPGADKTGIHFINTVQENEILNIMKYEYMYNGGGVAVGDLNNDGLADIYFSANQAGNKLYLNNGGLQFEDITDRASANVKTAWATGVSLADVNGDGRLDIYVCYSGTGDIDSRANLLYINEGNRNGIPIFSERAGEYGIDATGSHSTQSVFFDYDRDGDLDMFLLNHATMFYSTFAKTDTLNAERHPYFSNKLYRNDTGKFTDVSEEAGIRGSGNNFGLGIGVSDVNNDGWPDLYMTSDYEYQDYLLINNRDGSFTDITHEAIGHLSEFSMGCDIADYNNDGWMDIVVLDMLPEDNRRQKLLKGPDTYDKYVQIVDSGFHHQYMRNVLQLGRGLSKNNVPLFSEIGQLAGISNTDWSWAPLLADFDNDGWKDIFITNGFLRDFTNLDFVKFDYTEAATKAIAEKKKLNTWRLVENLPVTRVSNYMFSNNRDLRFTNRAKEWGLGSPSVSSGAAYADLDNDGDLDLVVNNTNEIASVFENHSSERSASHFLKLRLEGKKGNTFGIGAKITITTDSATQVKEQQLARGYQSSVDPVLHFGTGSSKMIKTIQVIWPDGNETVMKDIPADTLLVLKQTDQPAIVLAATTRYFSGMLFSDYSESAGIFYQHHETKDVDFYSQFLLPHQVSRQGPFITNGDVNGDKLEDVFIGGNKDHPGMLFLQQSPGKFLPAASQPRALKNLSKDGGAVFFDADSDGDNDLYIAKGGTGFPPGSEAYQDELYINDGKGNFMIASNALPELRSNSYSVAAADYDKDGDMDLFVGGYCVPGAYPIVSFSYLLRNDSKSGVVKFSYATEQTDRSLPKPGMVKSVIWTDINKDDWPDLVIAGEFMPVTVFENQKGKLVNRTNHYGLANTAGLWYKLVAADLDNDGDTDIVAGNAGTNTQWQASIITPLSLSYADFDNNGSLDPLLSYYIQGKEYPAASLDEMTQQLPYVKKEFLRYAHYAEATMADIIPSDKKSKMQVIKATEMNTCWFENDGKQNFSKRILPREAQFSTVNSILVTDVNEDGNKDLILCGNYYPWRVQWGRMDASIGLLCIGDGKGNFSAIPYTESGLVMQGDIRDMIAIPLPDKEELIIATRNNDKTISIKMNTGKKIQEPNSKN